MKPKPSGVAFSLTDQHLFGARVSRHEPPFEIEALYRVAVDDSKALDALKETLPTTKSGSYITADVGISPESRFTRLFEVDIAARNKSGNYYADAIKAEFRIDIAPQRLALIAASNGSEYDPATGKESKVIICGALNDEISTLQERTIAMGIYPRSLQLSALASLGAMADYSRRMNVSGSILLLDITSENSQIFIVREGHVDVTRPIPYGINSMIPAIKQELGLKDEESTRKLFFSNTFDFTEVGPKLLRKLIRELQASTGFYEVQTGQTITHLYLPMIPASLKWIAPVLAESLGVEILSPDVAGWLKQYDITFNSEIDPDSLGEEWFGLLALLCPHQQRVSDGEKQEKSS